MSEFGGLRKRKKTQHALKSGRIINLLILTTIIIMEEEELVILYSSGTTTTVLVVVFKNKLKSCIIFIVY